jgi:hypothetical protein
LSPEGVPPEGTPIKAISVSDPGDLWAAHYDELMSKRSILRLKSAGRFEMRCQQIEEQK